MRGVVARTFSHNVAYQAGQRSTRLWMLLPLFFYTIPRQAFRFQERLWLFHPPLIQLLAMEPAREFPRLQTHSFNVLPVREFPPYQILIAVV